MLNIPLYELSRLPIVAKPKSSEDDLRRDAE